MLAEGIAVAKAGVPAERRTTQPLDESSIDRQFHDEEAGEAKLVEEDEPLPKRLRWHRQGILKEFSLFGKVTTALKYFMYLFVVIVIVAYENHPYDDKYGLYGLLSLIGYISWLVLSTLGYGGAYYCPQYWRWGGYPDILLLVVEIVTIVMWQYAFQESIEFPFRYYLVVAMAVSLFIDRQICDPIHFEMYLFYKGGRISHDEPKQPVTGISNRVLLQAVRNASRAVGISDEALASIEKRLGRQRIRQSEEDALDDWAHVVLKLSKVVSLMPFGCRKKCITSLQYRNLARQLLIFLRDYVKTGELSEDTEGHFRTLPLSTFESMKLMLGLSWQVKFSFLGALFPQVLSQILEPFAGPLTQRFLLAVTIGDTAGGRFYFYLILAINFVAKPLFNVWDKFAGASFVAKMSDTCRRRMLNVVLKGGTKFAEQHRGGVLNDAFSNQVNRIEIFAMTVFIRMIPSLVGITASVILSGMMYPFAAVLFVSLVPIILSIDYFTNASTRASVTAARADGKLAGKIGSVVECRPSIRTCDAGSWIESDLQPMFADTRSAHYQSFLKSGLVESVFLLYTSGYSLLIFVPLGTLILGGLIGPDVFVGLTITMTPMIVALMFLGQIQSQFSLYSGSLQTIRELMDHSLDEESEKKDPDDKMEMKPLDRNDVTFRYVPSGRNVLNGVNVDLPRGSYTVLCGESGSGKSTVLNLLMRFREPNEGLIAWDGKSIGDVSLKSFREHTAVMFQKTMIYQATVRENISFGLPVREEDVVKAAKEAEIHDAIVGQLPNGYDTVIGGDSIGTMSGGQLQRICLARALYRRPSVLLLDEATSALDAVSEHAIIDTLVKLRDEQGLTMVSVSHHPSTAVEATQIVVLAGGEVAELGTYNELLALEGGIFKRLAETGVKED